MSDNETETLAQTHRLLSHLLQAMTLANLADDDATLELVLSKHGARSAEVARAIEALQWAMEETRNGPHESGSDHASS